MHDDSIKNCHVSRLRTRREEEASVEKTRNRVGTTSGSSRNWESMFGILDLFIRAALMNGFCEKKEGLEHL